ncbi:MAG: hypothetical protein QE263_04205 [Vampirovibrionales bacterium]|nr:hypothetical protein [Vampirovibrionales bacterium]
MSMQSSPLPNTTTPILEQQLHQAQLELAQLKQSLQQGKAPKEPTPDEQLSAFMGNPAEYVASIAQNVVEQNADHFLVDMREEAEFKGALRAFRVAHPDAVPFETLIFDEVAKIIRNDDDGVLAPWSELLEQGLQRFQIVFKETLKNNAELLQNPTNNANASQPPIPQLTSSGIEASGSRKAPKPLPSFTRDQIAKMSPAQFAENESAIEEAMRLGRIK